MSFIYRLGVSKVLGVVLMHKVFLERSQTQPLVVATGGRQTLRTAFHAYSYGKCSFCGFPLEPGQPFFLAACG